MPAPLGTALAGRFALVTGAGRGLGRAVAVTLASLGAHVIATARTQGGLEETDDLIRRAGGRATLLPLDLAEAESIDAIGPSLFQRFGGLDILVHAAATLGRLAPVSHVPSKDWEHVFAVNTHAAFRLIRTTAPLLRSAAAGRAVFVTDQRAAEPLAYWNGYGASKAAQAHLALAWAGELVNTAARVNLFDPGPMGTRLRRSAFPGEEQAGLPRPEQVAPALAALCLPAETRHAETVRFKA
jgi:NAD(P)-dependent dehydrogenase (short-subunit alcohol dehydrogenase family)